MRGRLITNCQHVELMPADSEHLWAKGASLSFQNPHAALLSGAQHGALLHAAVEVVRRIAIRELPVIEADVVQFRVFEEFRLAFDAVMRARAPNMQLVAVTV
uniref:Uncharacterized protein n=1 Tax=Noctiluca scintillans TaxID=2966 RepID=A0A7S1FJQ0_NOCSC|mmetsp:Transcript_7294/g.19965  ORF Transcript_7294/g.19965 Transcript_7294/m.19965 type:complete len:102 (+) Transcript_7294:333-638(+)